MKWTKIIIILEHVYHTKGLLFYVWSTQWLLLGIFLSQEFKIVNLINWSPK